MVNKLTSLKTRRTGLALIVVLGLLAFSVFAYITATKPDNTTQKPANQQPSTPTQSGLNVSDHTNMQQVAIAITDSGPRPGDLKIKKGSRVTWTNQTVSEHSIAIESVNNNTTSPGGEKLTKGQSDSFSFDVTGDYIFHCGIHQDIEGSITVVD